MNSKAQINNISKAGYYYVRNLAAIHNTLDLDSAKIVIISYCFCQGINTIKPIWKNQYDFCSKKFTGYQLRLWLFYDTCSSLKSI